MIVTQQVDLLAAWLAGLSTFFTPCILPLIPVWIAMATGLESRELKALASGTNITLKPRFLASTISFILGFTLIFVALGAAASAMGEFLFRHEAFLRYLGGAIMIFFGLNLLGIINPRFLNQEKRFEFKKLPTGYVGAFLVGMAFAAGWTPCAGPILGSLLSLAAMRESLERGIYLLLFFSLGLGLPFLVFSFVGNRFIPRLAKLGRYIVLFNRFMGVLMLILAFLVISDNFRWLSLN